MQKFLLIAAITSMGSLATAQQPSSYSRAVPPTNEALARLNLKADWTLTLPMSGQADGIAKVQVLDGDQIAVQTKAGLLVMLDGQTGRILWQFKYPSAFSNGFGVGVNRKFLFAVNVAKLYCFHRYTGLLEFEFELPGAPAASPIADGERVYISFVDSKIIGFELPPALQIADIGEISKKNKPTVENLADSVADRYASRSNAKTISDDEFDRRAVPKEYYETFQGIGAQQRSPSLSTLASVVPPHTLHGLNKVESLSILPSLRQPYKLRPDYLTYNQRTPSISVIPPSAARVHELSSLRPAGVRPRRDWTVLTEQKITHEPVLLELPPTSSPMKGEPESRPTYRIWITESGKNFISLSTGRGDVSTSDDFESEPAGPLAGPFAYSRDTLLGFVALRDGQVAALDLSNRVAGPAHYEWKANVGGFLNHPPVAAKDGVYVSGDHAGVAKIEVKSGDVKSGEVTWRTESGADRLRAVNDEYVYVSNRRGELLVYAKDRIHDVASKRARPLSSLNVVGFNVPITNPTTDRILLGADSGLLVCLRDTSAKYAKPIGIAPANKLATLVPKPEVKPGEPAPPTPVPPPKN